MSIRFFVNRILSRVKNGFYKTVIAIPLLLLPLGGCAKSTDYTPYVSELRSNIFLADTEAFSLRIYAVNKESPYRPDGIPHECTPRVEARLTAPSGTDTYRFFFTYDGEEFGGEMSYDNVKSEYYLSYPLDISDATTLPCRIEWGESSLSLNAPTVKQKDTLSAGEILKKLQTEEGELFTSLTDKYGFAGEIYVRLIYEEAPYYYVGIIDRNGVVHAYLLNAQSGKILAKRTT
jgi:hypothetical protein